MYWLGVLFHLTNTRPLLAREGPETVGQRWALGDMVRVLVIVSLHGYGMVRSFREITDEKVTFWPCDP